MYQVEAWSAEQVQNHLADLVALLQNVVEDGASIGFLPPLSSSEAEAYWLGVLEPLGEGNKALWVTLHQGVPVGSVQLALEPRANGRHRGEVQKLMVHTGHRRQGLGRQLMLALEAYARQSQRSLLVLDTRHGDPSGLLYEQLGYTLAGIIPHYARSANGELHATAFYYWELST